MTRRGSGLTVEMRDPFWAPRRTQLRDRTLPLMLQRLEEQGAVDNLRRTGGAVAAEHRGMHFSDSDLYKWMEAAAWAGRSDLLDPVVEVVLAAQRPDGYLHSYYGTTVGGVDRPRWSDLDTGHEMYCAGHFIECALAHEAATGRGELFDAARRVADNLCDTFGPAESADHGVDKHPGIELAMAALAVRTGQERYLAFARWAVETQLAAVGLDVATVDLAGHAVRALYLATGIAAVAAAEGDPEWAEAAERLFVTMVSHHSYPTGAVGGRWMGEAVGQRHELPEAMSYAESCAAVAATRFSAAVWILTHDLRTLEQIETLLYNAVPAGVGEAGDTWFYSQPHAVGPEAVESNPWVGFYEYGSVMALEWFPPQRHDWFDVACCPPNLARMFATVDHHVAEVAGAGEWAGDLLVRLPLACRIVGEGWDVEVHSPYPGGGEVQVAVAAAPPGRRVHLRRPLWSGRGGFTTEAVVRLDCAPTWWETDPRVEGTAGTVFLREGPVVHCVEGLDLPGVDLRLLRVDPTREPRDAFGLLDLPASEDLHRCVPREQPAARAVSVRTTPYHAWANRGATTMRMRFPRM